MSIPSNGTCCFMEVRQCSACTYGFWLTTNVFVETQEPLKHLRSNVSRLVRELPYHHSRTMVSTNWRLVILQRVPFLHGPSRFTGGPYSALFQQLLDYYVFFAVIASTLRLRQKAGSWKGHPTIRHRLIC